MTLNELAESRWAYDSQTPGIMSLPGRILTVL